MIPPPILQYTTHCRVDSEGNVVIGDLSYSWFVNHTCTIWNAPEIQTGDQTHTEKSDVVRTLMCYHSWKYLWDFKFAFHKQNTILRIMILILHFSASTCIRFALLKVYSILIVQFFFQKQA